MKRLLGFIVFAFSNVVLPNSIKYMPFDLGYQFGFLTQNGMVMWGEDWESNNLFFDGSWAIFPPMYGAKIEKDFQNDSNDEIFLDSSNVFSNIDYKQGDYGLDKFSIDIDYLEKNRSMELFGFKKSYLGNINQYYSNTLQPQQQSYIFSFKSLDNNVKTGLTIGHFNTLSGFPDLEQKGLFDNRITSLNYFWKKLFGSFSFELSMDQFLQRYKSIHSQSIYKSTRFLNRSVYKAELTSSKNQIPIMLGFSANHRATTLDSREHTGWINYYSNLKWNNLNLFTSVIKDEKQFLYDYSLIFKTNFKFLNIVLSNTGRSILLHPHYIHNTEFSQNTNFYKKYFNYGSFIWNDRNNKLSLIVSVVEDKQKFDMQSLSMQNKYSNINFTYTRKINSSLNASIHYSAMDTKNYYSGGIGNEIGLKFQSDFSLFNDFMEIELDSEIKYFFNRVNYSMINPVEMVPMIINENDHGTLLPIHLINSALRARVSTVIFEFSWTNLYEIILSSIQSDKSNFFSFHPMMPDMSRQIDFSINWKFQD